MIFFDTVCRRVGFGSFIRYWFNMKICAAIKPLWILTKHLRTKYDGIFFNGTVCCMWHALCVRVTWSKIWRGEDWPGRSISKHAWHLRTDLESFTRAASFGGRTASICIASTKGGGPLCSSSKTNWCRHVIPYHENAVHNYSPRTSPSIHQNMS